MSRPLNPEAVSYVPRKGLTAEEPMRPNPFPTPPAPHPFAGLQPRHPQNQWVRLNVATTEEATPVEQTFAEHLSTSSKKDIITAREIAALHIQHAVEQSKERALKSNFPRSPYMPLLPKGFEAQKRWRELDRMRLAAKKLQAKKDSKGVISETACMAGKLFSSNHSAVLSMRTIWCPITWLDEQEEVAWPSIEEFAIYASRQQREWQQGPAELPFGQDAYGSQEQDENLEIPVRERHPANFRSTLDSIVGGERWPDAEDLCNQTEQIPRKKFADIIGKSLWKAIEDTERGRIKIR